MRIESSILTSLSELKAIEEQRIGEERAAIEKSRHAEAEARRAAEQALADAHAARLRDAQEAQLRVERAKADAEREARMRVEATEASERARWQAQLEQDRLAQEMDLRRAEVAKKRPRWMLAVTSVAAVAAMGLGWYALDRSQSARRSEQLARVAELEKQKAKDAARDAQDKLDGVMQSMAELDAQIAAAQAALTQDEDAAGLKRASDALAEAYRKKADAQRRADELRRKKDAIERGKVIDVTGCTDTALGCLKR